MMKIKNSFMILSLLLFACKIKNSDENDSYLPKYPLIIDSLKVSELFDETKWNIYLLYCMDTPRANSGTPILENRIVYGNLDLKFDSISVSIDTFRFYFDFYVNDTLALNVFTFRDLKGYANGMMFYSNMSPYKKCYVYNHSEWSWGCIEVDSKEIYDTITKRQLKPLQPDVIKYLNKHQQELNPWLLKEAKKRGVIPTEPGRQ